MNERKAKVVRYLFALSDHKVWAYIVRENPTEFELKPLDGAECQNPAKCPGQLEGYLHQWKNAMSLKCREEITCRGQTWQLPSLEGVSVCLLSDGSDPVMFFEMTGILDKLWRDSEAARVRYEDIPWKREDFQAFLDTRGQPFGGVQRVKAVKADALAAADGRLELKVYGGLETEKKPAPSQPLPAAPAAAPRPESRSAAPLCSENRPPAERRPEEKAGRGFGRGPVVSLKARAAGLRAAFGSAAAGPNTAEALSAAPEEPRKETTPDRAPGVTAEQAHFIMGKMIEGHVDTVVDPR